LQDLQNHRDYVAQERNLSIEQTKSKYKRELEDLTNKYAEAQDLAAEVRFDERLGIYSLGEDDDFSYRLSRRGRIRYEPAAVVCHEELGWRHTDRRRMDCLQVVNRTYLFRKNFSQTPSARAFFAALLALLCAHRVLNRDWPGLRGLVEGIRHARRWGRSEDGVSAELPHAPWPAARLREHDSGAPLQFLRFVPRVQTMMVLAAGIVISVLGSELIELI